MLRKQIRGFKLRPQFRTNAKGVSSVKLVSTRKLTQNGKQITAGQAVDKQHPLSQAVVKPKARLRGSKLKG